MLALPERVVREAAGPALLAGVGVPLAALPNVMPLPGMSMRDAAFWRYSAEFVAKNLDALANGTPLAGVVQRDCYTVGAVL